MVTGKDNIYNFFWVGNSAGTGGIDILLVEKWIMMIDVNSLNDRTIIIKLLVGQSMISVFSVYAPQCGLDVSIKDKFYEELLGVVSKLGEKEITMVAGDLDGHVGRYAD